MDPWLVLLASGVLEVGFTTCLKLEQRHKGWAIPSTIFVVASFSGLAHAVGTIPLGTAYAVWTGIGAIGTMLVGALAFGERPRAVTWALLILLVGLIVALKAVDA